VVITGSNEKAYRKENYEGVEVHYLPVAYDNAFGFGCQMPLVSEISQRGGCKKDISS